MTIVAVTLLGPGCALPARDRLPRGARDHAPALFDGGAGSGSPLPEPFRFDTARNHARLIAAGLGDWCLYVDADMTFAGRINEAELEPGNAYAIECEGGGFASPLLIHRTCPGYWYGRNHEYFTVRPIMTLEGVSYREAPKTPDQIRRKAERGLAWLPLMMREDPDSIRWPMYLAQTHEMIGDYEQAARIYANAAMDWFRRREDPWVQEQRAWGWYRAGAIYMDALVIARKAFLCADAALGAWPTHGEAMLLRARAARVLGDPWQLPAEPPPDPDRRGFRDPELATKWAAFFRS